MDKVDRRMPDILMVKKINDLGTNVSSWIATLKVANLGSNSSPQIILAKSMVLIDWLKPHETRILLRPGGHSEYVLGCPEDQLGAPASGTPDSKIV
jgi:hypothetical protein